jgi:hypothetical protein
MDEDQRCVNCGHMPDVCQCPHDCYTQQDEAVRLADLAAFFDRPGYKPLAAPEDPFDLFPEEAA